MNLPTNLQTEAWYTDNIDHECSASSAIYKFRIWLSEREKKEPQEVELSEPVITFILSLNKKYTDLKKQLESNMKQYQSSGNNIEYDKMFSAWNRNNLMLWDLQDILCRMGHNVD